MNKKFIACIYLYRSHAVRSPQDQTVVESDPVKLARFYCENNADEIIVFDMSDTAAREDENDAFFDDWRKENVNGVLSDTVSHTDALHDAAIDEIRKIVLASEVDVIGAGNINRVEDVKKLLYAGCSKVVLDFENRSDIEMIRDVSERFGREKILVSCSEPDSIACRRSLADDFASGILLTDPHCAGKMDNVTSLPIFVYAGSLSLNKFLEILSFGQVGGITGNTVNDNIKELPALKELCRDNGIDVNALECEYEWSDFHCGSDGLIPVIVQDFQNDEVLMMAYMNEKAYRDTLLTGKMHYYSRSRQTQWLKGETSGHYQYVKSLYGDCDMDTILVKVSQVGAACHTGARSCFFNEGISNEVTMASNPEKVFEDVYSVILDRKDHPREGSYTNYLFDKGIDKILKKLGEEATEITIAAKNPNENEIKYEISDFLYHLMVLMVEKNVTWEDITEELAKR